MGLWTERNPVKNRRENPGRVTMSSERGGSCSGVMIFFSVSSGFNHGRQDKMKDKLQRIRESVGEMDVSKVTKTEWCRQFASGKSQPSTVPDKNLKRISGITADKM